MNTAKLRDQALSLRDSPSTFDMIEAVTSMVAAANEIDRLRTELQISEKERSDMSWAIDGQLGHQGGA